MRQKRSRQYLSISSNKSRCVAGEAYSSGSEVRSSYASHLSSWHKSRVELNILKKGMGIPLNFPREKRSLDTHGILRSRTSR